ncbi:hypothetical protein HD554DRAFT_2029101, partial [Boletus coccyginus]
LGFLPFQYQPHPSDYSFYLDCRDHLLHQNYVRVTLTKGGIIACLTCDSIGSHMNMFMGFGPSEDVCKYGTIIRIRMDYLWDDELDPNNEQIICGVYKIFTDPSQGEQTANISWWPKESPWEGSGLDISYWSTDNEVWFQKHLKVVHNYNGEGCAPCYSTAEWWNKLKYHRANKIVGHSRDITVEWLSQVVIHG